MRNVEITLKLAFLALSVSFVAAQSIYSPLFDLLLVVCIVLGLVLMINKHSSYKFKHTSTDYKLRQVEGGILVLFAVFTSTLGF